MFMSLNTKTTKNVVWFKQNNVIKTIKDGITEDYSDALRNDSND